MPKKLHIETYGCQMNEYESDRTFRLFHEEHGYEWTPNPADADLVIYNTCSIRAKADQKAFSSLGRLRVIKNRRPELIVAVGGCMAQSRTEEIRAKAPHVDVVFGTHQWKNLPGLVERAQKERKRIFDLEFYGWQKYEFLPYRHSKSAHPVSEFVTIQNGCNKFCTFCLVPFTRGREVSRPPEEILEEVEGLAESGVREVTLLGQNVNAYGEDRSGILSFSNLLRKVSDVGGIERIRFVTSHPSNLSEELMEEMIGNPKVCNSLHLPLQSGSNRILKKMERDYSVEDFAKKIEFLRRHDPEYIFMTDLIVGFPSETEDEFKETLEAMKRFDFGDSYSFVFSPRPNTKAATWSEGLVSEDLAKERLSRLQDLQKELKKVFLKRHQGQTLKVLVEGEAKKGQGRLSGRTEGNWTVNFEGSKELLGGIVDVEITDIAPHTLKGAALGKAA